MSVWVQIAQGWFSHPSTQMLTIQRPEMPAPGLASCHCHSAAQLHGASVDKHCLSYSPQEHRPQSRRKGSSRGCRSWLPDPPLNVPSLLSSGDHSLGIACLTFNNHSLTTTEQWICFSALSIHCTNSTTAPLLAHFADVHVGGAARGPSTGARSVDIEAPLRLKS